MGGTRDLSTGLSPEHQFERIRQSRSKKWIGVVSDLHSIMLDIWYRYLSTNSIKAMFREGKHLAIVYI